MKIAHVALWTPNLDEAADFLVRYFDASVGELYESRRRQGFMSRFVRLQDSSCEIELMTGPWIEGSHTGEATGWHHIAISLDSREAVDTLAERCRIDGCLESGPRMTGDGYYEAVVKMPDGTPIEITA
jgi:lactoylglutathione lyase